MLKADVYPTVSADVLAAFGSAEQVVVPCRRFVVAEHQQVLAGDRAVPLLALAGGLGVREQVLNAYAVDETGRPAGRYTETGRQEIVDALGTIVTFAPQPTSDPMVIPELGITLAPTPVPPAA